MGSGVGYFTILLIYVASVISAFVLGACIVHLYPLEGNYHRQDMLRWSRISMRIILALTVALVWLLLTLPRPME